MHEGSIAQGILANALGALPPGSQVVITRITIVVGGQVGVVPESLELYFRELSRETPAAGAHLDLQTSPAWLVCGSCLGRVEYHRGDPIAIDCVTCGGANHLEGGRDLYLKEMEVQEIGNEKLDSE